jgi:hypothetical protein
LYGKHGERSKVEDSSGTLSLRANKKYGLTRPKGRSFRIPQTGMLSEQGAVKVLDPLGKLNSLEECSESQPRNSEVKFVDTIGEQRIH